MSGKVMRLSRKIGQHEFNKHAKAAIYKYIDRLCSAPLRTRLSYAWRFIRGRNPHTGVKVRVRAVIHGK